MGIIHNDPLKNFLAQYEAELNPLEPEKHRIPTKILGYGEISTVLAITPQPGQKDLQTGLHEGKYQFKSQYGNEIAVKRMPMFKNEDEAKSYRELFFESIKSLKERVGIDVVHNSLVQIDPNDYGKNANSNLPIVMYIIQEKLEPDAIGNRIIHLIPPEDVRRMVLTIIKETEKVFRFNHKNMGKYEIGFDGQISNWVVKNYRKGSKKLPEKPQLAYFDTSSPLLKKNDKEQLNPELFLRSAPSFMVWIIRLLFLNDVLTRYYDFRKVIIDLLANFYKEKKGELVPELVDLVNNHITSSGIRKITVEEVDSYYREDAFIWRIYLAFRKIDRFLKKLLGMNYPYILPGKIER